MAKQQEPEPTRLESAEEIRKALEARKARKQEATRDKRPGQPPPMPAKPRVAEAKRERPVQRPPMGLLCVLDDGPLDGKHDGEWFRLRAERTVLGRTGGDVQIPHDGQISGEHAEIVRDWFGKGWRWLLRDLGSTNGTYVRVGETALRHDNEFLIGLGRYRFEASGPGALGATLPYEPNTNVATVAPQAGLGTGRLLMPTLVEMGPTGPVNRFVLSHSEYWLGRQPPEHGIARPDDPFADAQHARLYRKANGHWHIANNGSLNGLWLRVKGIQLDGSCQFRLGEQRFLFRVS